MYDVVIIGAGPGGYVCAIVAAQLGAKVCIVEKDGLGGTCTQRGCIPTKYFHSIGEIIRRAKGAKRYGIEGNFSLNYDVLKSKMFSTVSKLASGIKLLLENNDVDLINGEAKIISENKIGVNDKILETKNIVIATGSHPICIPGYEFGDKIVSTDSIFDLENLPKSILIVGGGYSGCEFASILNAFGCKVWLVEVQERLMPKQPVDIGMTIEKYMKLDGISVLTNSSVEKITKDEVMVNGKSIDPEKILVCTGREPNLNRDELDKIGIKFDNKGIIVNEKMQTSIENVYAIGDITGKYELAHVASKQGEVAAQNIMGKDTVMDYSVVPFCVFTYPEVAFVGRLEGKSGEISLAANAKANCLTETKGFVKVFEENGICIGAIIVGPHAGELISEPALAIRMRLSMDDVLETIHAHPTLPEAFVDAIRDAKGSPIHTPVKTKTLE